MKMLLKLFCTCLIINTVLSQVAETDLNSLINTLFTTPSTPFEKVPVDETNQAEFGVEKPCTLGVCLPYYQCNNTNGEGIIDVRIDPDDECHYLEVCCPEEDSQPKPTIETYIDPGCGKRHVEGIGFRIATDTDGESQFGEFPWMAAVMKEEEISGHLLRSYLCGGALIHPKVILTAAHCASGKTVSQLKIRVGEWDTQTTFELYAHQDRDVSEIVIHEEYYKGALYNDIALLVISQAVELAENVGTICLPPQGLAFDGKRCTASGWGNDQFGREGKPQVILKKIELPIVPNKTCLTALRGTRLGRRFVLHNSFICAGGESGRDTCKGDGGSPLVCPIPGSTDRYYQSGIVAWGIGCGENRVPGVYANVALFRTWIDTKMNARTLDTSSYKPT